MIIEMKRIGICILILFLFCSCKTDKTFIYSRILKAHDVLLNDTVRVRAVFDNSSRKEMSLYLFPECECTSVEPSSFVLRPSEICLVDISFPADYVGYYEKLIFLQTQDVEVFDTIIVRGNVLRDVE